MFKQSAFTLLGTALATGAVYALTSGLTSPDRGVVCNTTTQACYDKEGPSLGLTEIYMGQPAAAGLMEQIRSSVVDKSGNLQFKPAENITCFTRKRHCIADGKRDRALTQALFGALLLQDESITGITWQWQGSHYNNDTESVPDDPSHYTLQLQPDGKLNAQVDCNRGGGKHQMEEGYLTLDIAYTTRAFCGEASLDQQFLKDISTVQGHLLRGGKLHLMLKYDTGAMTFSLQP
ncbi:YcgJ family protein [endosymbiont of Lamellibrachia barhami]|uniref:YcgJ family protein n=1 Tax=endosymbiont of Lamellibrachia barhami TaxID=205975 RepID=UPI0015B323C8|nr:YcgJ family protein [endosymbiont of Lamellibrachia barhami]